MIASQSDVKVQWDDTLWLENLVTWTRALHQDTNQLKTAVVFRYGQYSGIEEKDVQWLTKSISWVKRVLKQVDSLYKTAKSFNEEIDLSDPEWLKECVDWLERLARDFVDDEILIKEMIQLEPDLSSIPIRAKWKKKFVKRHALLRDAAESLGDPLDELTKVIHSFKTQLEDKGLTDDPGWLLRYIRVLESGSTRGGEGSSEEEGTLEADCKKFARNLNIQFNRDTFYDDLIKSDAYQVLADCNEILPLWRDMKAYFKLPSTKLLRLHVEDIFQKLASEHSLPLPQPEKKSFHLLTFEEHLRRYLIAAVDYIGWSSNLSSPKRLMACGSGQQEDAWLPFYVQWLSHFNLDADTPREAFLEKLRERGLSGSGEKRSSSAMAPGAMASGSEKKMKVDEKWSSFEIQNVFVALYKEYFTLKWRQLSKLLPPSSSELVQSIERKLRLLQRLKSKESRENVLLEIYKQYVEYDLALITSKPEMFTEITSIDILLQGSMTYTLNRDRKSVV